MELLYVLLVLLAAARLAGEVAERIGQPPLVGELVAGVALGLVVQRYSGAFPVLSDLRENEVFTALTDLAIFFLMLFAGVETQPRELAKASKRAVLIAVGGMLLPLVIGFALGWAYLPSSSYKPAQALFLGVALAITAVPVSVRILMDLGRLDSPIGQTIVSAALIDDVLSLVLLAVLTAMIRTGSLPDAASLFWLAGEVAVFFAITIVIGRYLFPWLGRRLKAAHASEFEMSGLLIAALGYGVLAESLGMHFILGAFIAGLFFVRRTIDPKVFKGIRSKLSAITMGFFAPLFFASVGMHLDLAAAVEIPLFVMLLVVAAFLGKLAGAGLPALALGFDRRESLAIGAGMSARGAVELIIAGIALRAGLFAHPDPPPAEIAFLFSAVVIMALATTLVTPIVLKRLMSPAR